MISDFGGVGDFSDFGESDLSDLSDLPRYWWGKPLDGVEVVFLHLEKFIRPLTSILHTNCIWRG